MAFRLKLVSGGTTYYVTTLQQTSLNMNAVPPFINTGSLTGLTTDADLATDYTAAQVKEAKMAYPAFISEAYVAPAEVGDLSTKSVWLGSVDDAEISETVIRVVAENIAGPTATISLTGAGPGTVQVSLTGGGGYAASIDVPVVGGVINRDIFVRVTGAGGASTTLQTRNLILTGDAELDLIVMTYQNVQD